MVSNGVMKTKDGNGKILKSRKSATPVNGEEANLTYHIFKCIGWKVIQFHLINVLFSIDFDLYTIATAAYIDQNYHAAVIFLKALVKMMKKNIKQQQSERLKYLNDFDLSYDKAKKMYRAAIVTHDNKFSKYGPYGASFRCNIEPFMSNTKNVKLPEYVFEPILDRKSTFEFNLQKTNLQYTKERIENKRKNWTKLRENTKENQMRAFIAPLLQAEKLCNGTQLRVGTKDLRSIETQRKNI